MKRWMIGIGLAVLLIAATGKPFQPVDLAKLKPLVTLKIDRQENEFVITTDTGDHGRGRTVDAAFEDLKESCAGEIFPDTAQFILITERVLPFPEEVYTHMRPSCELCILKGSAELPELTEYLSAHRPGRTLAGYRAEKGKIPVIYAEEGAYRFEKKEAE